MKQLEPDPWEDLMKKYPVYSTHKGVVRNLTNFGVFVELEPGVDGLVHISDLSWTKKIRHPGEFVKKGDELDVVVLSIDPEQRRIALGHKQIKDNPWDVFETTYKVGSETEARIERIIEKGVIVELPDGVDGFVPVSQLSFAPVRNISEFFQIGDKLPLKVVEFDKEAKKIVLSVVESLRNKDQADIAAYNVQHPVPNADKFALEPPAEIDTISIEESIASYQATFAELSKEFAKAAAAEVKAEELRKEEAKAAEAKAAKAAEAIVEEPVVVAENSETATEETATEEAATEEKSE
jgi:small subunit ribosomal protein S1